MVQVDLPISFGVGALMATAVEDGLRTERKPYFYLRGLAANLILQMLFIVWLPVYLLASHFGFQTSHMWWHGNSLTDHPTMLPVFLVAYFAASLGGYHTGIQLVLRNRAAVARGLFVGSFVFFLAWMALQPGRTLVLGTYDDWVSGRATWIWLDQRFMALLGAAFVLFWAALWLFYRAVQRESRAAVARAARV